MKEPVTQAQATTLLLMLSAWIVGVIVTSMT